MGRYIPADIKRIIRKKANFGCVICGNPIIEYHHIVPYSEVKNHEVENIVALCPEHHHRVGCSEISQERLNSFIKSPYNARNEKVQKDFMLSKYDEMVFKAGGNMFVRTPNIVVINDFPLIKITSDEEGYAVLDVKFYNRIGILQAEIKENEWIVYKASEMWDISYSPGSLKINKSNRQIFLELRVSESLIELRADLYYDGSILSISPTEIKNTNISLSGNLITDCKTGINIRK